MTIWLAVEDRIAAEPPTIDLYRALHATGQVRFVRYGAPPNPLVPVAWPALEAELAMQAPAAARDTTQDSARPLPASAREAQLQAFGELGRFGSTLLRHQSAAAGRAGRRWRRRLPPLRRAPSRGGVETQAGDTLLALGAPWLGSGFAALVRSLRDERRMRVGVRLDDLLPIRRPEWAPPGVGARFGDWCRHVLPCCDLVLTTSRHTASDIAAYARESGFRLPGAHVVPMGAAAPEAASDRSMPGEYVLLAGTMEPSSNHALAFRIWQMLLDEVRAGRRAAASVPDLVFAGPIGWRSTDLLHMLDNTGWLGGRIRMIQDPAGAELRELAQNSLFSFAPSFADGSGWPVAQSLALGKPCLAADAGAYPEIGGALCRYSDPENLQAAYQAVTAVLDDRPGLAAWEADIRRQFRATPWSETAQAVLNAVASLS